MVSCPFAQPVRFLPARESLHTKRAVGGKAAVREGRPQYQRAHEANPTALAPSPDVHAARLRV